MEVAVLGGGHGCYAAAAELSEKGHRVRFWRRDAAAFEPVLVKKAIELRDHEGERSVAIAEPTTDLGRAIAGAHAIVIPLPSTTHDALAREAAPHWRDGQVVFLPPGTFGSYLFLKAAREAGNSADVTFAETGTLPYLARKHGAAQVVISAYGKRLPTGCLPSRNAKRALAILSEIYPAIEPCEDALSGALMNAGPIIHPPLIMMNAGPLEHFERWDIHNEGTQPAIRRVTDQLDAERVLLRTKLGYKAPHFPLADHYAKSGDEWMYGRAAHDRLTDSGDWREHIVLREHRYMLEDTRLGLSFIVSVGKWLKQPTPIASGFLAIASAVVGRDLYAEGRTLERLGLADMSRKQMQTMLSEGL